MTDARLRIVLALALTAGCSQCNEEAEDETAETEAEQETEAEETPNLSPLVEPLQPPEVDMDKVYLGRRLYHDPILSGDGTVSCATCHSLEHGGAEDRVSSEGIGGAIGPINSPTVLNAHFNFRQFWDGRAADLQEQAAGPVENPIEMGGSFGDAVERIAEDDWYPDRFAAVYGGDDPITKENITDAIAEYERYLVTPAPWDDYLRGDVDALTDQQKRGWATFQEAGCIACHQGVNLGGTMYQKLGAVQDYFEQRGGEITEADLGRFNVTEDESDKHVFKVATLRNVTLTPPYFHDGSQTDLRETVRIMGRVQLGKELTDAQVDDIVAFLGALEGELPDEAQLPEDQTPPDRTASAEGATGETAG
jgi:cytochrome c peroxidase